MSNASLFYSGNAVSVKDSQRFLSAVFIGNWGQGIQKICKECRDTGADMPEYELVGTTLSIRFKALSSALLKNA